MLLRPSARVKIERGQPSGRVRCSKQLEESWHCDRGGISMSSLTRAVLCSSVFLALAGCSSLPSRSEPAGSPTRKLSKQERVAHVLSRLTFGARSGDAERVAAMGIDRWIDQQLNPESIPDSAVTVALASNTAWNRPTSEIRTFEVLQSGLASRPVG